MQKKWKIDGVQQKLPSKINYHDRRSISIAHFFICSSSCPYFHAFRDEACLQMLNAVTGENEFKPLTIPYLKKSLNAEHSTFKKSCSSSRA